MKAALAARVYRDFDPDNNGSIDPADIVRAFARVKKADDSPWVPWEKAHAIAHTILSDADTDAGKEGGQFGLSYIEFMTCLEGDSIDFEGFLRNLKQFKDAPDREECRKAFEEERSGLPPVVNGGVEVYSAGRPAAPPIKLELTEEEKEARLERRGVLKLHLIAGEGLPAKDKNGFADPYVVVMLGKKEKRSTVRKMTLDPVWPDEIITFKKTPPLHKVVAKGITLGVKDQDEGMLDSDDLIGKVRVDLEKLEDHSTIYFREAIKPQGTLVFSVTWEDTETDAQKAE